MSGFNEQEFTEWVNHPMTCLVRNHLIKEMEDLNSIDQSLCLECNVSGNKSESLEMLGLNSYQGYAIIQGIDKFTDTVALLDDLKSKMEG